MQGGGLQQISECIDNNEDFNNIGTHIIHPSSYIGGP
jgi:hypothetical protein